MTQTEKLEAALSALRGILTQEEGDLSDEAFRKYVCTLAGKTLAKVESE